MIELISAAKVGKKIEIDVSLLEKVVSNQEKIIENLAISHWDISHWDRYLGMMTAMTQVPVPTT